MFFLKHLSYVYKDWPYGGLADVDGSVEEGESDGVGGPDGTEYGSNGEGGSTSIEVDVVEPVWVNDKSGEHIVSA